MGQVEMDGGRRVRDFRPPMCAFAPLPVSGCDAERPSDQFARHHAAEEEHPAIAFGMKPLEAVLLRAREQRTRARDRVRAREGIIHVRMPGAHVVTARM